MSLSPRSRLGIPAACAALLACAGPGALAQSSSESGLKNRIAGSGARERAAGSAAARLGALERRIGREVSVARSRFDEVDAAYREAAAALVRTQAELGSEQRRLTRMRTRLRQGRTVLAGLLVRRYESAQPDLLTIVLDAGGVADVLDRIEFERRVRDADAHLVADVATARADAAQAVVRLGRLRARRADETAAARSQRDGAAAIRQALSARQAQLAAARAARLDAQRGARADRLRAERELRRLEAARRPVALTPGSVSAPGPGGPWAIPWAVVQCESGGQNLPPNSAGASGYYQFMPDTWRRLGGSTPAAYKATKSEQDRLAAKLWNGGKGASNWVCATR